jgi:hypothetical protein
MYRDYVEYPKTIVLKQLYGRHDEGRATEQMMPGQLVKVDENLKLKLHDVAGGPAVPAFAKEDAYQGRTIDHVINVNDVVFYHMAAAGDEIYTFLDEGETAVPGDLLESAGNGNFVVSDAGTPMLEALEEVDNTEGDGPHRIKARVLG